MTQHKMMRGIFLCTFIARLLFSNTLSAQTNFQDVVFLKNGSIIHGTVVELVPNESIRIKTMYNDVILFKMDEIQKITREQSPLVSPQRERLTDDKVKTHGFTSILEFFYSSGSFAEDITQDEPNKLTSLGFVTVNGYMFNPHLSTGIGIGIQGYDNFGIVPVYADVRFNVLKGTITPFVSFDVGYSVSTDEIVSHKEPKTQGGVYSNLSIGIKFFTREAQALAFSFGYTYQDMKVYTFDYDQYFPSEKYWEDNPIENMALKFSFVF